MIRRKRVATIEDLYRLPDGVRAEIVNGVVVRMPPNGFAHGRASMHIARSLSQYEIRTQSGFALPETVFAVDLPNRRSFLPDAAFYLGPPSGGKFLEGAPVFAAEVRGLQDYGLRAERALAAKRAEYFAAGTQVVWDVDVVREGWVRSYRADGPDTPMVFKRGEKAHAEPALPDWRVDVDEMIDETQGLARRR